MEVSPQPLTMIGLVWNPFGYYRRNGLYSATHHISLGPGGVGARSPKHKSTYMTAA
jgi:hypothetical protein